jgi:hypothetical protein
MSRIRVLTVLSLVAASSIVIGCRRTGDSDPLPATLPGSYVYAANGTTLRKPWQFAAQLELRGDKTYTFTLDKTVEGNRDPTESSIGTYVVSGDHVLMSEPTGGKASKDVHNLLIKADSLIPEVGWTAELFLKGVGAPNIVFVKKAGG